MVIYLDYNKFLELISDCEITINLRDIKEDELDGLFKTFNSNNTFIEKQIGLNIPYDKYDGAIKTVKDFKKLGKGDIMLIIYKDKHYLSIVEEVMYNGI